MELTRTTQDGHPVMLIDGTWYHIREEKEGRPSSGGASVFYYHAGGNQIRRVSVYDDVMQDNGFGFFNRRNGYFGTPEACVR